MAEIICTSAPRPTRSVTPSTSTSIVPTSGSDLHRNAWRRWRRAGARATTSTTAGTNGNSSASEAAASLNWRRQPNNCCGENPWRRATAQTEAPLATISATIRALSSWRHFRRRPAPVKTSSRRTGSVIAICSVSILSPTVKNQTADSQIRTSAGRCPQNNAYIQGAGQGMKPKKPNCQICRAIGWVCENHPDKAWDAELGCVCGAGVPCKCNETDGVDEPDVSTQTCELQI